MSIIDLTNPPVTLTPPMFVLKTVTTNINNDQQERNRNKKRKFKEWNPNFKLKQA